MADYARKLKEDIMTPERLRNHWFSNQRVPFWDYDPNKLTIGLEIEYFIAKVDSKGFTLATKQQYLNVIKNLIDDSKYYDRNLKDQPGRVSKDTESGFIAIKPDFAWHILEIALPPRKSFEDIQKLLEETFREVDQALAKEGLERLDISCLPDIPEKMDLVELDRLSGYLVKASENSIVEALSIFPALITATHVHINCCNEEALRFVPDLYVHEIDALNQFTRANLFQNQKYSNVRSMLYEKAFGPAYTLRTVPDKIPSSLDEYVESLNSSPKIFPNDPFFAARDMSYIRPTRHGTFEFRSACSFKEINKIVEIAKFRHKQVVETFTSRKVKALLSEDK